MSTSARLAWAVLAGLVLLPLAGAAAAQTPRATTTSVLAIDQSAYVTEQGNLTVSVEVANTANIHLVYYTFCQLTYYFCYFPVAMTPHGSNWYVGSTQPMSSYHGMTVGISAGYNITIVYNDNSTQTEPSVPNSFTNLTVAQTSTGDYYFQMTVMPDVFGLSGVVSDASTGAAIAGASVTLTPGSETTTTSSAGAYTFSGLLNGSYTLAISGTGYRNTSQAVTISGKDVIQNIAVSDTSSPSGGTGSGPLGGGIGALLTGPNAWMIILPVVAVIAAAVGVLLARRNRRTPVAGASDPEEPARAAGPK